MLELPTAATQAYVEINGQVYLRKIGDRLDVSGSVEAQTPREIRLRVR